MTGIARFLPRQRSGASVGAVALAVTLVAGCGESSTKTAPNSAQSQRPPQRQQAHTPRKGEGNKASKVSARERQRLQDQARRGQQRRKRLSPAKPRKQTKP